MLKSRLFILSFSLLIACNSFAQNQSDQKHNEQVTIVSSYDPTVNQAFKQNISPEGITFNIDNPEFEYKAFNIDLPTTITVPPINPVAINLDRRPRLTKNSLKVGVSSLFGPLVDFFHSSGQRKDYRFDAHVYHLSSFKNIPDYANCPETNTQLNLGLRKFYRYHVLSAGFDAEYNSLRWYGFKPDDYSLFNYDNDDLKQAFTAIKANVALSSSYNSNKKLHHEVKVDGYYYFDKHNTTEANANLSFDIHKNFDVSDMLDYQELGISGGLEYYNTSDSIITNNDLLIEATPYFTGNYNMFNFYVGLNFNFLNTNKLNFYFYPILNVDINLVPDVFTVFGGITGNVKKHSYYALSNENQWVNPTIDSRWGRSFTVYGGIRGNITGKVNYSAKISWKSFKNEYFFINASFNPMVFSPFPLPFNKFNAVYDNGSVFTIAADVSYILTEKINIEAGVSYMAYSLDSLPEAYQKPGLVANLGFDIKVTKKLSTSIAAYYYGERTAMNAQNPTLGDITMDQIIDLNAGVGYILTDKFDIFLNVNNILNQNYQVFNGYPVHGILVMGGFSYRF